jgi:hypothetical protein
LVNSIDCNTKTIALNTKNISTLDDNVENTEKEISKMSWRFSMLERSSKMYFDNLEKWTVEVHQTIKQIQDKLPEVSYNPSLK